MDSPSLYDIAHDAIRLFYWEHYSLWMLLVLAVLLWTSVVLGYRWMRRSDKQLAEKVGDTGKYTIVALPPDDRLAFPEFCVGCGQATSPGSYVRVSAGISGGTAYELSVTPGTVVGHSVNWKIPSCAACATEDSWSQVGAASFSEMSIWAVMILWFVVVAVGFTLVISAMDFLQLVWLLPAATLLFFGMSMPATWLVDAIGRHWARFRGREVEPLKITNPLPSVFFRIEKVERLPGGMSERALPWGPHVYHFMFEHVAYAERFNELNGGVIAPFDSAGRRKVREPFHTPLAVKAGLSEFVTAFAITFAVVLVLASIVALFGAFRLGQLYSLHGLGLVALGSACLAFGYTLGPDEAGNNKR